jgi:hypothetical protein
MPRGDDIAAVATRLRISLETGRGYLRRVLAMTDTHRQCHLNLVLMREPSHPSPDEHANPSIPPPGRPSVDCRWPIGAPVPPAAA